MSGWSTPINIYCERNDAGFWAEPVNALTNIAFVLAALWGAQTMRALGRKGADLVALILLAAMIGVGSFLFHSFATRWSALADVIPIWSFVVLCILSGLYRVGGIAPRRILIGLGIVVLCSFALAFALPDRADTSADVASPPALNGSLQYAPAWIAMVCFALVSLWRRHPVAYWILAATVTFSLSLVFRTIDPLFCIYWPLGTHFMWHVLNGLMIGLLLQALLRAPPART